VKWQPTPSQPSHECIESIDVKLKDEREADEERLIVHDGSPNLIGGQLTVEYPDGVPVLAKVGR
jgi:hypothetical protein